jgi:hypothetical protein
VASYKYPVSNMGIPANMLPPEDVIHMKRPHPLNDFYGLSPIEVAAAVGDLDNYAIQYLRTFFQNNGIPGGFVKIKQSIIKEKRDELKQQFRDNYQGEHGFHAIGVLDADAEYVEVGANPQKLNLAAVFGESESRICAIFGVPPIVVAVWIGLMRSTYANYESAMKDLWVDTQVPKYRRIADKLNAELAPEFGDDLIIDFDMSRVEALQENREEIRKFALDAWDKGLLYRNQALELAGLAAIDGPVGDEYKAAGMPIQGAFSRHQVRLGGKTNLLPLDIGHVQLSAGEMQALTDNPPDEPEWKQLHRAADSRAPQMRRAFLKVAKQILDRIDERQLRRALDRGDATTAMQEIPWDAFGFPALKEDYTKLLAQIFDEAAQATSVPERQSIKPSETFVKIVLPDDSASSWAAFRVGELIREVGENTKEAVRQIIDRRFLVEDFTTERAVRQIKANVGLTPKQETRVDRFLDDLLKKGVEDAYEQAAQKAESIRRFRARLIARTEGIRAASAGQEAVWREAQSRGIIPEEQEQFWIVTPDDALCEICAPMKDQRRKLGEAFTTGSGASVMGPPAHPSCRCARGLA